MFSFTYILWNVIRNEKKNFQILAPGRHLCAADDHIRKTHLSSEFAYPKLSYLYCGYGYPEG